MLRKTLTTAALTATLVVSTAGMASAHECFVAKRSDKGDAAVAAHSTQWETVPLAGVFAHIGLDQEQTAEALEMATEAGIPLTFTTFARTIPVGAEPSPKSSDGKGIDHYFASYGAQLMAILEHFGVQPPPPHH